MVMNNMVILYVYNFPPAVTLSCASFTQSESEKQMQRRLNRYK